MKNDPPMVVTQIGDAAQKRQEAIAEQGENDLTTVMGMPAGRRFVWQQIQPMFEPMFRTSGSESFYRMGRHDCALELYNRITSECPELFEVMQQEALQTGTL